MTTPAITITRIYEPDPSRAAKALLRLLERKVLREQDEREVDADAGQ